MAVLAAGALMFSGGVAHAAPLDDSRSASVEVSPELESYLDTLTPAEQAEFIATKLPASTEVSYGQQVPADATAAASMITASARGDAVTPMATGCWTLRVNGSSKAAAGNTLYTYFHVGRWCASGSTVTSANIQDRGGETSTPGWRMDGPINGGSGVVSNQGRSYSQMRFILGAGPWDVQSPTPCLRVNGLTNGTGTTSGTCGIY
jgi:hypothetical protein